jgi:catechol 2,3-dioxygenase-like lactoylglutathione lyase family enzyme
VIGRFEKTVIDCPDPRALAEFYCQALGMRVDEDTDGWVVIGTSPGLRQLAFQRVAEWVPPRWPDPAYPQQLHLDIRVADAEQAEQELLALGATRVHGERETGFRVLPTLSATLSASSSAGTAQAEPPYISVRRGSTIRPENWRAHPASATCDQCSGSYLKESWSLVR